MELMQLEMFVAAVEEGSVHKAAERVYRTQPAVSMALRKLEQEIGAPLFDRSQRHQYLLTAPGELLYNHAATLLSLRDRIVAELRELSRLQSGRLVIGANESLSVHLLPKLAQAFHQRYPAIKLELAWGHSSWLLSELRERRLDVALLSFLPETHDLETRLLMRDEVVLVVSPEHSFAGREEVSIKELAGEGLIVEGISSPVHQTIVETFARFETPLNVSIESAAVEAIKRMVAMNMGVGLVPLFCVRDELARGDLVTVPVREMKQERSLCAARRRAGVHSPASQAFMQLLEEMPLVPQYQLPPISAQGDSLSVQVDFWNRPPVL